MKEIVENRGLFVVLKNKRYLALLIIRSTFFPKIIPLEGVGGKKKVPCFLVILEFWRKPRLFLLNVWMLYCFISWKGPSLIDPAFLRERHFLAFRSLLTTQQNQTLPQQIIPFSFYLGKNGIFISTFIPYMKNFSSLFFIHILAHSFHSSFHP